MTAPSAAAVARRLADELEAEGLPYAVGGALALGVWGVPRGTVDVDLDLFLDEAELPRGFAAIRRAGCEIDEASAIASACGRGDFRAFFEGMRVDVFVPCIPFYDAVRRRIRAAPLEGRLAWFLAPEDLAVFKMLFFRTKDILDLERLVAVSGSEIDRALVRASLVDIVGDEDARVRRWDALVVAAASRP
ncbi:MAG: hypothetical protein HYY06_11800 [Deltaproteobacteria bacterium]|nr:hypothetical protein [Deltaproteobacteria bacterium]